MWAAGGGDRRGADDPGTGVHHRGLAGRDPAGRVAQLDVDLGAVRAVRAVDDGDDGAVLLAVGVVALWWLFGGVGVWWQPAALAGVLAVAHLGGALAAAAPSYAAVRSRALRRMLAWTLGYLAACAVGVAVVLAVTALPAGAVVRGPVWVWLGLTALVGAGIWAVANRRRS